jgi:hypothetical protein
MIKEKEKKKKRPPEQLNPGSRRAIEIEEETQLTLAPSRTS